MIKIKRQIETGTVLKELTVIKKAPLYHVVLLNDDFTPMDFVVEVIEMFFHKEHEQAVSLMLRIHQKGKAICGTYEKQIAETKVAMVTEYARNYEHPLLCVMESVEV